MAYDHWRDKNGVTWTVGPPAGWTMFAYVPDDAQPKYDPPATDQTASTPPPDNMGKGVAAPTGEQVRVIFLELVKKIEAYASAHAQETALTVTASPPFPWWVWGMLGLALLRRR